MRWEVSFCSCTVVPTVSFLVNHLAVAILLLSFLSYLDELFVSVCVCQCLTRVAHIVTAVRGNCDPARGSGISSRRFPGIFPPQFHPSGQFPPSPRYSLSQFASRSVELHSCLFKMNPNWSYICTNSWLRTILLQIHHAT